ncbi:hypothetical protein BJ742DRAFT_744132 [Cladochytrium replicatum]|nr:hypothetical protein BJ742DRAFT_744132 [Cladochytrium replicatum]
MAWFPVLFCSRFLITVFLKKKLKGLLTLFCNKPWTRLRMFPTADDLTERSQLLARLRTGINGHICKRTHSIPQSVQLRMSRGSFATDSRLSNAQWSSLHNKQILARTAELAKIALHPNFAKVLGDVKLVEKAFAPKVVAKETKAEGKPKEVLSDNSIKGFASGFGRLNCGSKMRLYLTWNTVVPTFAAHPPQPPLHHLTCRKFQKLLGRKSKYESTKGNKVSTWVLWRYSSPGMVNALRQLDSWVEWVIQPHSVGF